MNEAIQREAAAIVAAHDQGEALDLERLQVFALACLRAHTVTQLGQAVARGGAAATESAVKLARHVAAIDPSRSLAVEYLTLWRREAEADDAAGRGYPQTPRLLALLGEVQRLRAGFAVPIEPVRLARGEYYCPQCEVQHPLTEPCIHIRVTEAGRRRLVELAREIDSGFVELDDDEPSGGEWMDVDDDDETTPIDGAT